MELANFQSQKQQQKNINKRIEVYATRMLSYEVKISVNDMRIKFFEDIDERRFLTML